MPIELTVDVTEAAGLGQPLSTRVTVVLPEPDALADPPVVCFGFPGGGYSRGYFTFDMPGTTGGGVTDKPRKPGGTAAPATRSSTQGCGNSARRAGCTIGPGSSLPAS